MIQPSFMHRHRTLFGFLLVAAIDLPIVVLKHDQGAVIIALMLVIVVLYLAKELSAEVPSRKLIRLAAAITAVGAVGAFCPDIIRFGVLVVLAASTVWLNVLGIAQNHDLPDNVYGRLAKLGQPVNYAPQSWETPQEEPDSRNERRRS